MYETYFSLRELPFSVTPDPRFLYINSSYQEAFATLCYGVEQRKGIIVITGQAGTGKTTLVKTFLQNAASTARISCVLDPHLSFLEILRCTADAFGLPPGGDNRLAIIQQLKEYLLEQLTQDHVVALFLDEAQDLDDQVLEELRLLSDLEHAGTRLLQLVLIGQLELETSLNRASLNHLRQRIALRARLTSLGDDEIRAYIDFRLAAAGYAGAPIFQRAAVQRIAFFSHGVPRLINVICDNALLIACVTNQVEVGAETIDEVAEDLQLGGQDANPPVFVPAAEPSFEIGDSLAVPASTFDAFDAARAAQEGIRERGARIVHPAPAPGNYPASNYLAAAQGYLAAAQGRVVPVSLQFFLQNKPREVSVVLAAMIVILGGVALFVTRPQSPDYFAPVTEKIEQIHEVVAPIPQRVYRVLTTRSLWENPLKNLPRGEDLYSDVPQDVPPVTAKSLDADKKDRIPPKLDRQPRRSDRVQQQPMRADGGRSIAVARGGVERPRPSAPASNYSVVGNSYVRSKPTSEAQVIATLRPGTRIKLVRRSGEYWQIRSLETEAISGYVHKEDAFFEPSG
jgi:type II secretory pathway predicted ATPase ExeA